MVIFDKNCDIFDNIFILLDHGKAKNYAYSKYGKKERERIQGKCGGVILQQFYKIQLGLMLMHYTVWYNETNWIKYTPNHTRLVQKVRVLVLSVLWFCFPIFRRH